MQRYPLTNHGQIYHFDTGPFNWYVIAQEGRITVVDAGFPGHFAIFAAGIRELGYEVTDVAAILLTHGHADHMGFAERLRTLSNAPVYVHPEDRAAAGRPRSLPWRGLLRNAWRPYVRTILGHATLNGVFRMPGIARLEPLRDGATLDVPGRPHVLHAPGHTPGSVAFYLPAAGVLISGDALVTRQLLTGESGPPQLTPPALTDDTARAGRSRDRLRELGSVTLLPGHGDAWHGDLASLRDAAHSR